MRFTTAPFLAHFLDLDPSIYVVALYQIVGGGDLPQSRELSPRFARRQLLKIFNFCLIGRPFAALALSFLGPWPTASFQPSAITREIGGTSN